MTKLTKLLAFVFLASASARLLARESVNMDPQDIPLGQTSTKIHKVVGFNPKWLFDNVDVYTTDSGLPKVTDVTADVAISKLKFCRWAVSNTATGRKSANQDEMREARANFVTCDQYVQGKVTAFKADMTKFTATELKYVINDLNQVVRGDSVNRAVQSKWRLNPGAINGIVYPLDEIDSGLDALTEKIVELVKAKENPIAIAAFAFQGLNTLHVYSDGNGRTCVFFGDIILQTFGVPPAAWGMYSPIDPIAIVDMDMRGTDHTEDEAKANIEKAVKAMTMAVQNAIDIDAGRKHCSDKTFGIKDGQLTSVHVCSTHSDCAPNRSRRTGNKINQWCCLNPDRTSMLYRGGKMNTCTNKRNAKGKCNVDVTAF